MPKGLDFGGEPLDLSVQLLERLLRATAGASSHFRDPVAALATTPSSGATLAMQLEVVLYEQIVLEIRVLGAVPTISVVGPASIAMVLEVAVSRVAVTAVVFSLGVAVVFKAAEAFPDHLMHTLDCAWVQPPTESLGQGAGAL